MARRNKRTEKLSVTIEKVLSSLGLGSRLKEYSILGRWDKIVGEVISRHARPIGLRSGKLSVVVDSPVWKAELVMHAPTIIEKVNQSIGREAVQDISFRIGEVVPSQARPEPPMPSVPLTQEEHDRIDDTVRSIEDPGVRDALRKVMEKDAALKKRSRK